MRAFVAHLWKEWREHRLMLGAIGAAIVLLTAGGAWAFYDKAFEVERGSPFYVAGCTALTVFALATELFAAEGRRDGFAFLRRLPRGLGTAWAAKIVFYVLACALTAAFGAATLLLVTQIAGGAPAVQQVLQALDSDATLLAPALVVTGGLWILLLSIWVPRGAAAAGAALLLLAALGTPVYLELRANPEFRVPAPWIVGASVGVVLVPLLASLLGLLRGLRFARGSWSAAWRGLALVCLVAAPCYAAGSARIATWGDLQADEPNVELQSTVIARGGRFAYANIARRGEGITRAFRIDLQTGAALPMAPLGSLALPSVEAVGQHPWFGSRTFGLVAVYLPPEGKAISWWDAEKGTLIKTLPHDMISGDLVAPLRRDLRASTPVRTADGRPVWIFRQRMEHDAGDGSVVSIPLSSDIRFGWSDGFGWLTYDRASGRYESSLLVPDEEGQPTLVPRARNPTEWARFRLTARRYLTRAHTKAPWEIVDGGSGTPTSALEQQDEPVDSIDATHALFWRRIDKKHRAFFIADFATGTSSPLALPAGAPASLTDGYLAGTTPAGRKVFHLSDGDSRAGYAVFDPSTRAFLSWTPAPDRGQRLVGVLDETTLVESLPTPEIVRRTLGTGASEVLFPRR